MVTTRFALAPIPDYKSRLPSRSYVLFDGKQTGLVLEGTMLKHQFETYSGFLLWLTFDPALNNSLQLYLLSPGVTVLDVRSIAGSQISSDSLTSLFETGDDCFQFTFFHHWQLRVLKTPRFQIIRRACEWGEAVPSSIHHTAFFARRYLELRRAPGI